MTAKENLGRTVERTARARRTAVSAEC